MKEDKDLYISYHQYSTFKNCPAIIGYWDTAPKELIVDDHRNAVVGSVVHNLAEAHLKGKITVPQMHGLAGKYFTEFEADHFIRWRGKNDRSLNRAKVGLHIAALENLLFRHSITPNNVDSESQHKVKVDVDGQTLKIGGRIDVRRREPKPWIFDFKASERVQNVDIDQMRVYFIMEDALGNDPEGGSFLLTHFEDTLIVERDPNAEKELLYNLLRVATRIRDRDLPLTPGRPCSWCEFGTICPGHKKYKRMEVIRKREADNPITGRIPWSRQ